MAPLFLGGHSSTVPQPRLRKQELFIESGPTNQSDAKQTELNGLLSLATKEINFALKLTIQTPK